MIGTSWVSTTSTRHVVLIPLTVSTRIIAYPSRNAVTLPSWSTVATEGTVDIHVSVVSSVVSTGSIIARSCWLVPASSVIRVWLRRTEVIGLLTVTSHDALTPFSARTVIVVVPGPFAVTLPVALTSAIVGSSLSQLRILLSVVLLGTIVAFNPLRVLTSISSSVSFSSTAVIGNFRSSTCTVTLACAPSGSSAVMTASPPLFAVITPFSTEATSSSVEVHVKLALLTTA